MGNNNSKYSEYNEETFHNSYLFFRIWDKIDLLLFLIIETCSIIKIHGIRISVEMIHYYYEF